MTERNDLEAALDRLDKLSVQGGANLLEAHKHLAAVLGTTPVDPDLLRDVTLVLETAQAMSQEVEREVDRTQRRLEYLDNRTLTRAAIDASRSAGKATWMLAVATIVLAVATIVLVWATLRLE